MIEDPIVADVRRNRKALAEEYGHDLRRLVEVLRKREKETEREILSPGPRRCLHATES